MSCRASHIVEPKTGKCLRCGEYVSQFDAMEAAYLLRQGKAVRQPHWEREHHVRMIDGKIAHVHGTVKDDTTCLTEILGPWELANEAEK